MYCAIDETEESPSSEDEPLPGAAAALSALSDLTLPLSALGELKTVGVKIMYCVNVLSLSPFLVGIACVVGAGTTACRGDSSSSSSDREKLSESSANKFFNNTSHVIHWNA